MIVALARGTRSMSLNPMQQEAVDTLDGAVLILAGAGSGKTTVLINRIANIIEKGLAYSSQILAITFTKKAAGELKERLESKIGEEGRGVWSFTFHSTAIRILRADIEKLGIKSNFTIYDASEQKTLIKNIMKQLNMDPKMHDPKTILRNISSAKDQLMSASKYEEYAGTDFRMIQTAKVYREYEKQLNANNALDFDDIIMKAVLLLDSNTEVLEKWQNRFKYIMVDEYQDTNHAQYQFIRLLSAKHGNVCVVGDDDQSIYKFRGANIENILNFEKHFPNSKIIKLEQNYRSTGNILDAANNVIKHNYGRKSKKLWTDKGTGEKIEVFMAYNDRAEAKFIVDKIKNVVMNTDIFKYNEFAVLYRTNAQSRMIEEELIKQEVPYNIVGGFKFFERKEVKDVIAYLKLINNSDDDMALSRVINTPKRGIGKTVIDLLTSLSIASNISMWEIICHTDEMEQTKKLTKKLASFKSIIEDLIVAKNGDFSINMLVEYVYERSGYKTSLESELSIENEARIENIGQLVNLAKEYQESAEEPNLTDFLESIALYMDTDELSSEEKVTLMTLHSAKGLEFPVVFIAGMEENIFPSYRSLVDGEQMDEERRLCYVGITRAKEKLFLTHARQRMQFGRTEFNPPSQFLSEIPPELKNQVKRASYF